MTFNELFRLRVDARIALQTLDNDNERSIWAKVHKWATDEIRRLSAATESAS